MSQRFHQNLQIIFICLWHWFYLAPQLNVHYIFQHAQNPQVGIQQPVCFQGAFDYRARFDGIAQPNIPVSLTNSAD